MQRAPHKPKSTAEPRLHGKCSSKTHVILHGAEVQRGNRKRFAVAQLKENLVRLHPHIVPVCAMPQTDPGNKQCHRIYSTLLIIRGMLDLEQPVVALVPSSLKAHG